MHLSPITPEEVLAAPAWAPQAAARYREARTIVLGPAVRVCFEDRAMHLDAVRQWVAEEGLSCPVSLAAECDVTNEWLCQMHPGVLAAKLFLHPTPSGTLPALFAAVQQSLHLRLDDTVLVAHFDGVLAPTQNIVFNIPQAQQDATPAPHMSLEVLYQNTSYQAAVDPACWIPALSP